MSVTGHPDNTGDQSKTGAGGGEIYWSYLSPLLILTDALPDALLGVPYAESLVATGGTRPYTWGILTTVGGTGLPPNLSLSTDGKITGTPIQPGRFVFSVGVTDANRQYQTADLSVTVGQVVFVLPPPPPHPLPPPPGVSPPVPPTIGPPGEAVFVVEESPGIDVWLQPLLPDKCTGTLSGFGTDVDQCFLDSKTPNRIE